MYLPIPEGVNVTDVRTAKLPKTPDGCNAAVAKTATASFSIARSTVPLVMKPNFRFHEVNRPLDGKWSDIKDSGQIKMTEMSIKNESIDYYVGVVTVPFFAKQLAGVGQISAKVGTKCVECKVNHFASEMARVQGSYVEQGDLDYWKSKYPNAPHYSVVAVLDQAQVEAEKSRVYAELFQSYNLGEEVAELRETIAGVTKLAHEAVDLILRFRKSMRRMVRNDVTNEAGSRWMEFRYGIMPIMYSIQDMLALKRDSGLYRTIRAKVASEVETEFSDSRPNVYFEDVGMHNLDCFITAKARWASEELKRFDLININPLTTTTAVLPWAMVIRWFFNVQSYLDCRVKSLTSLSLESRACVAIRERRETGTYLCQTRGYDEHVVQEWSAARCEPRPWYGTVDYGTFTDMRQYKTLLSWHSINNYQRYLFNPSDVKLVFNPYITWQRAIDALVMMMGPMSRLLRRLK